jgi:hypothetical protein
MFAKSKLGRGRSTVAMFHLFSYSTPYCWLSLVTMIQHATMPAQRLTHRYHCKCKLTYPVQE